MILLADGYAGLQPIEDGRANLCLLVQRSRLQRSGNNWHGLLQYLLQTEPHLRTRLADAVADGKVLSITRVPYGFVHTATPEDPPGVFRLGDQMAVIPSFTGDGMSIALHSAVVAADHVLAGKTASAYHSRMRRDVAAQIGRAGALYRLGRSPTGGALLMHVAARFPAGLRLAASLTRVPRRAVARSLAVVPMDHAA